MSYIKLIYNYNQKSFPSADDAVFTFFDHLREDFPDLVPVYESDQHISCIIKVEDRLKFQLIIKQNREFSFTSSEIIEDKNWLESCLELWEEINIKNLTITQIVDADNCTIKPGANQILIQPGTGFGTGHHACTAMLIDLIQQQLPLKEKIKLTLDFGTGSGILAIAIAKVLNAKVVAIDNDSMALENAKTNKFLNSEVADQIELLESDSIPENSQYDLIVANIYSSLIIEIQESFKAALKLNSPLLLSGILNDQVNEILRAYSNKDWKLNTKLSQTDDYGNVWHALGFERQ